MSSTSTASEEDLGALAPETSPRSVKPSLRVGASHGCALAWHGEEDSVLLSWATSWSARFRRGAEAVGLAGPTVKLLGLPDPRRAGRGPVRGRRSSVIGLTDRLQRRGQLEDVALRTRQASIRVAHLL